MPRITKWKMEKAKVKVVFRLHFQATQIPQSGWDKLFVSFIPTDSGKMTAKTSKASVRNGSCKWSDPIYETTNLLQDPKTKDYNEKLYKLAVAMGSSHSSLLGEVVINLADFVGALKPSSASLPLHGCDFGTILHVNVQLLTSKTGFREFEQQRELSVKGFQASSGQRMHEQNEDSPATSGAFERNDKVNARVRFKGDSTGLPSLEEVGELDEEYRDSAAGADCSSYTSESLFAERNDFSGSIELDGVKSRVSGDVIRYTPVHSSSTEKEQHNYKHISTQLSNDWSHGSSSDYSIDNDLASTYEDSVMLNARLKVSESSILQLQSEALSLQNISDELSFETQNLAQQLTLELASGEKLAREVDILKSDCLKFKDDLDELKAGSASRHTSRRKTPSNLQSKFFPADSSFQNKLVETAVDAENNRYLPCEFHTKLLREIFLIECKVQQIQNEACSGYNGNGSKHILSEFDVLGILVQNLKQSIAQESVRGFLITKDQYSFGSHSEQHVQVVNTGADLYYSAGIKEEKVCELLEQLEISETEDGSFTGRMSKVESYYESIIHELDGRQKQTSDQLENLRDEHSSCIYTISVLQNQTKKLHEELNAQLMKFAEEQHALESFVKKLENKAMYSETMLKKVRWNYAIAVDRLQKDLELLSFQVLSMYEANEIIAKQALAAATDQHCGEYSEEMEVCHGGQSSASANHKKQKPAHADIQHDTAQSNGDHGFCSIFNSESDKSNHKMLYNFSSKQERKGTTESSLFMDLDFHVNKEPNASINALTSHDISSVAPMHGIMQERKDLSFSHDSLMENQRISFLHSLHVQKPIAHSQISDDLKNMKDIHLSPPPEYSQIFNNTETIKDTYHCFPLGNHMMDFIVSSKEKAMSVDVPKQLFESLEAELSEVLMFNLQLEVHEQVLKGTLREVFSEIGYLMDEVNETQKKMKHYTNNEDVLVIKLHSALDESRTLREAQAKCITRYNDLLSTFHIMEVKLNEAFDEKNLLAQTVADCHSLMLNSEVYETKYKICVAEKDELKNMLKQEKSQRTHLQSKISSLTEELKSLKEQHEKKCSLYSDLQIGATDVQINFENLCKYIVLCNQQVDSIFDDIHVEEELDSENYDAIINHLEQFQQKVSSRLLRLQHEKKVAEEQIEVAECQLNDRESHILYVKQNFESELEEVRTNLAFTTTELKHLQIELQDAVEKLKFVKEAEERHRLENAKLSSRISFLESELQQATDECRDFYQNMFEADNVKEELSNTTLGIMDLTQGNKDLFSSIQSCNDTSLRMEYDRSSLKDILHYCSDRIHRLQQGKELAEEQRDIVQCILTEKESYNLHMKHMFESELEEFRTNLEHSRTEVQHLHVELQDALGRLFLSKEAEERHRLENKKLLSNMSFLEVELQRSTDECRGFCKKLLSVESANEELANTKSILTDLIQENKGLLSSIQSGNEVSAKMEYELSSLKEALQYAHENSEIKTRELQVSIADKLQFLETSQLLAFNEHNAEFCYLKARVLEVEKEMQQCVLFCKERDGKVDAETESLYLEVANMEDHLVAAFRHLISADVELVFMRNQFYSKMAEFVLFQKASKKIIEELYLEHLDVAASLQKCIVCEAEIMAVSVMLSNDLQSAESTIEALFIEKEILLVYITENTVKRTEFKDLKDKAAISEVDYAEGKQHYEDEICLLKSMLLRLELDELWLMQVEFDILVVFLTSKLSEQGTHIVLLEERDCELRNLKEKHIDLIQKLSEQILKAEEFKNLSIHLRDLKNKADAECHQAHEKIESEGSSFAVQESLRIAFIKEQYESKIQELTSQCSVSRRYAEELLMKLQSSLIENESIKKSEAYLSKRNEEMSVLLADLDTELQTVMNDRRELIKACDRMKAELECTILSFECCKEEKQKLQNSLKGSSKEKEKIRVELDLVKRLLEDTTSTTGTGVGRNYGSDNPDARLIGEILEDDPPGISFMYGKASRALDICSEDKLVEAVRDLASEDILQEAVVERVKLLENNATQIVDIKEHFREQQRFLDSMEILHKQLQRLKIANSKYQLQEVHLDADLENLHRELSQLDTINEHLESIFPAYKKLTSYENSLERVLSMELELAEALQVKRIRESCNQRSFLNQHVDDEAIFQSFKDINELIKHMIELKKRNVDVEAELQEMHGRFTQLSLQFAEVEGERQKLVMSLKYRTPKKL